METKLGRFRKTLAGVSLVGATLTGGGSAWAASYGAVAEVRLVDTPTTMVRSGDAPVDAFAAAVGGPPGSHSAPTASATVGTAGVHLTAIATAQVFSAGTPATVYSSSEARGGFSDIFVINVPGLAGTVGTATVAFMVSGAPSNSGGPAVVPDGQGWGSSSSWSANFQISGATDGVRWEGSGGYSLDAANYLTNGTAPPGTLLFTFPVQFNSNLYVSFAGVAEARAGAISTIPGVPATVDAYAAMLLGNTIAWGGITDLRDANGAVITNFDATSSDTGFNYAHAYAVPEPGVCALLLTGLGAGRVFSRRKK